MHTPSRAYLGLAVLLLSQAWSGCASNEDEITNAPGTTPVVVRGSYSYVLSLGATDATIDFRDSIHWYPQVAYLSITISNYTSGAGTLEITDSSETRVCIDNFNGSMEMLNRKLASAMPLRLRLSLRGFTGEIICGLQLGPSDINGMVARFVLRDSTGSVHTSFPQGQQVDFSYAVVNMTGHTRHWAKADSRPMCRFTINRADSLTRDSFEGFAFLQVPVDGYLQPGDSVRVGWRGITSKTPLGPGHYAAFADPQFVLTELGFLAKQEYAFDVTP